MINKKIYEDLYLLLLPTGIKKLINVLLIIVINVAIELFGVLSLALFFGLLADNEKMWVKFTNIIGYEKSANIVVWVGIISGILVILRNFIQIIFDMYKSRFIWDSRYVIRRRILDMYYEKGMTYLNNQNSGGLIQNLTAETEFLSAHFFVPLFDLAYSFLTIVFLAGTLAYFSLYTTIATLIFLIFFGFFGLLMLNRFFKSLGRKRISADLKVSQYATEAICGFRDIAITGSKKYFLERFNNYSRESSDLITKINMNNRLPGPIIELLMFSLMLTLIIFTYSEGDKFSNFFPTLVLFSVAGYRLLPAFKMLLQSNNQLRQSIPIFNLLVESLREDHCIKNKIIEKEDVLEGSIELKMLTYQFAGRGEPAIKNINLVFYPNTATAILGKSGSGKTTLINLVMGLISPSFGSIVVGGKILSKENVRSWQNSIGLVSQDVYLIDDSVAANIAFGIPAEKRDYARIEEVSHFAQLQSFVEMLPERYESKVGERGVLLSAGQRQRIGLARALYRNPKVLILDEATSNLDPSTEKDFLQLLDNLDKKLTLIVIAHRISAIRNCNRIVLIEQGEVIDDGSYQDITLKSNKFAAIMLKSHKEFRF